MAKAKDTPRQKYCEHCGQTISNGRGYFTFSWNLEDHKIVDVSDGMCEFLEMPKDGMMGKSWFELPIFHPEELKVLKSIPPDAFREGCYLNFTINGTWTKWTNRLREIDGNSYIESYGYAPNVF